MIEKRFTTVELPEPSVWGIWYDGEYLSTYQICTLLNEFVDVQVKLDKMETIIRSAYESERTSLGRSVLKQLMETLEI